MVFRQSGRADANVTEFVLAPDVGSAIIVILFRCSVSSSCLPTLDTCFPLFDPQDLMSLASPSTAIPLHPLPAPATNGTNVAADDSNVAAPETDVSASDTSRPALPDLPYSLRDHKRNIAIIWSLLALDAAIMPLALFYPLWYASDLEPAYIFAVTTGVFGIISGLEWAYRSWRLWRQEWVRPFGGRKNGVGAVICGKARRWGLRPYIVRLLPHQLYHRLHRRLGQ